MKNDFLDEVRDIISTSGIPADRLEIEITESIMIDSVDKALNCIDEIHKMGIKIAIDDFGTGYSSKQYVAAIISIGHIMGFEVISEGVEQLVRSLG